jgi:radical SAM protein with 4Fe4S-binding SPASM domain
MRVDLRKNARRLATVLRREVRYRLPRPVEVNLELTHRCNLRCRMCGVWGKTNESRLAEMTGAEYAELFAQMRALGVRLVTLAGGEPFIRSDLFEIIAAAKEHGLACNLFTNGTLLDRAKIRGLLASRVDKVIFSVDGVGPVHDAVRGVPGSFDKSWEALSGLAAERRLCGGTRPEIDVHMTLLKENVTSLSPLDAACRALGVTFSFQPYSETTPAAVGQTRLNGHSIGSVRYLPHRESLRFTDEHVDRMRSEMAKLPASFYTKLLQSLDREQLRHGLMPVRKCYITRNFMMIDPYGNVYPCTNLDGYIVGSVRSQPLSAIWSGKPYALLRKELSRRLLSVCAHCCHCADNLTPAQLVRVVMRRGPGAEPTPFRATRARATARPEAG